MSCIVTFASGAKVLNCVLRGARYAILLSHDDPEDADAPYVDAVVGNVRYFPLSDL